MCSAARSCRSELISGRLAAGEGYLRLHSFRRANITVRQEEGIQGRVARARDKHIEDAEKKSSLTAQSRLS
jgi:hypothetical protein